MTNTELQKLFQSIMLEHDNIFDAYLELPKYVKNYKQTTFYSKTKFTIYQAFELYLRGIGQIDYMVSLFKNIDMEETLNIMDRIADNLSLESTMNQLSDDNKELLNNILPFINQ